MSLHNRNNWLRGQLPLDRSKPDVLSRHRPAHRRFSISVDPVLRPSDAYSGGRYFSFANSDDPPIFSSM